MKKFRLVISTLTLIVEILSLILIVRQIRENDSIIDYLPEEDD